MNYHLKEKNILLWLGVAMGRKNMTFALTAIGKYRSKYHKDLAFVLIGNYTESQLNNFNRIAEEYSFKDRFKVLSNVSNNDLGNLFSNAIANVCPLIAEGFFLPIVEGLACDCLPLSSTCLAQCEILKNDNDLIFSLNDESELINLLNKVVIDSDFVKSKLEKHKDLPNYYSSENVSRRVWGEFI